MIFNWFFVICGAVVIAMGTRQIMSGDTSSFVDVKRYTDYSVKRFVTIEGFLCMGVGAGFILQGLSGLGMLPPKAGSFGIAIVTICAITWLAASKIILEKRF